MTQPAALLLTGGASRRMGRDKASLPIGGSSLSRRTGALLAEVADPVVEVGPGYTDWPRAIEPFPGHGPLYALAAGARFLASMGYLGPALVVATDLPRLTGDLLAALASWPAAGCVVPLDGGRPQPLCARYSQAALASSATLIEAGHRSLMALLERVEVTWLTPDQWVPAAGRADALVDVDTPEDLAALEAEPRPAPAGIDLDHGWAGVEVDR